MDILICFKGITRFSCIWKTIFYINNAAEFHFIGNVLLFLLHHMIQIFFLLPLPLLFLFLYFFLLLLLLFCFRNFQRLEMTLKSNKFRISSVKLVIKHFYSTRDRQKHDGYVITVYRRRGKNVIFTNHFKTNTNYRSFSMQSSVFMWDYEKAITCYLLLLLCLRPYVRQPKT